MGEIRDAIQTQKKIIEAAKKEFYEKGFTNTKVEGIAKRAGVKSQLIYYYFKDKNDLIEKVIKESTTNQLQNLIRIPANPLQVMEHRFNEYKKNIDYLKFTAWEAIDKKSQDKSREETRKEFFNTYTKDIVDKQEVELITKELDPALLTLAITSLTTYPLIFGDVTRMITGLDPTDLQFEEKWTEFLNQISEKIFSVNNDKK